MSTKESNESVAAPPIQRVILDLKHDKRRSKSALTKITNELLTVIQDSDIDRATINDYKAELDKCQQTAVAVMEQLCRLHGEIKDLDGETKVLSEIEQIESEYAATSSQIVQAVKCLNLKEKSASEPDSKASLTTVEKDLCRQMKRVSIPVFSGDKKKYDLWRSAFYSCIDRTDATAEYKLLQMRQYLSGEALSSIEGLGHSVAAYETAKEKLDRKYGGERRQVSKFLEEIEQFPAIKYENAKAIERFADLLDLAVVNIKEHNSDDLQSGFLYIQLLKKLPESMLVRYNRWIENTSENGPESVEKLREWMLGEAKFYTAAAETKHGLNFDRSSQKSTGYQKPAYKEHSHFVKPTHNKFNGKRECKVCRGNHGVWNCDEFKQLNVEGRWEMAKKKGLCFRCLDDDHVGQYCTRARACGVNGCSKNHNRLLHKFANTSTQNENIGQSGNGRSSESGGTTEGEPHIKTLNAHFDPPKKTHVALRTVPVILKSGPNRIKVNALLDDGSTKSYINADVAAQLGVQGQTQKIKVNVLNGEIETFETMPVNVGLESLNGQINMNIDVLTATNVTGNLKAIDWNRYSDKWSHLKGIRFPTLGQKQKVDLLIGVDYANLHMSYTEVCGNPGEPIARLTPLGWTCIGDPNPEAIETTQFIGACYFARDKQEYEQYEQINSTLKQFWEVEHSGILDSKLPLKAEDKHATEIATDSLTFSDDHYEVAIPWKAGAPKLANNYRMAKQRLENTEKKLTKNPEVAQTYIDTIQKYLDKGYIRKVPQEENDGEQSWYLPHFPVLRPEKETTKVRIVFDASATYEGISLNDTVYQGPKLQNDLFDVLLRFRKQPVGIACDIEEMYLRVGIIEPDRKFHRFLWRAMEIDRDPDEYEFSRLVFGVNCSPFLAQFVTREHAKLYMDKYPKAAETIVKSTYMDDSLDSVRNIDDGIEHCKQLSEIWESAGMHARKWLSNATAVVKSIPVEDRASKVDIEFGQLPSLKTLGVLWHAEDDVFTFKTEITEEIANTKREFLSKIASLFDPLGLLSPYTIRSKMLLQEMWISGRDWDDNLDEMLYEKTKAWFKELEHLEKIRVDRCLRYGPEEEVVSTQIHVFVDASTYGHGAVAYERNRYKSGSTSVRLIAAKNRVAPVTAMSVPRLELMGAVLGLRLAVSICSALNRDLQSVHFWSDSMNVLWWIRGHSRQMKPFVANRVGEIQTKSEPKQWRYVETKENPADVITRGTTVLELSENEKWWHGPPYLQKSEFEWPKNVFQKGDEADNEMKTKTVHSLFSQDCNTSEVVDPKRYSSWTRLTRVYAWVWRFVNNCREAKQNKMIGELSPDEIREAETELIKQAQYDEFRDEYKALQNRKELPKNSKILNLKPKLDQDGLVRSDGRLKYAEFLPYDVRFPIILPRKNWITKLIVKHYHEQGHHAIGTNQTMTALSSKYWLISAREEIRDWERECMECRRRKAKQSTQIMAPLPDIRLTMPLRAFAHTSVDFGGPFITIQGRGKRREKRYLCLFTCLASRAIHLEMAFGLDTNSFMNAFYRMVSRRGLPLKVLSDNGTNFVGANRELTELLSQLDTDKIAQSTANKGITWVFNPPSAPHFGGVHETMIKAAKRAIFAIIGQADITDEELMTAFTGAEALINSRPLTYQSAHPMDNTPLTPNHFLFGQSGGVFAPDSVDTTTYSPIKRWRRVQELVRHFWKRWLQEWLPGLSSRKKWTQQQRDIVTGDVVLVVSPDTPRGKWPLGRVLETRKGRDGHVRVVRVRVGQSEMLRPITKLCKLELDENHSK